MTLEEAIEHAQGCVRNDVTSTSGKALIALLEAYNAKQDAQPVAIPDGWKLVPIRPTRDMLVEAGFKRGEGEEQWHAMLAASPPPPDSSADAAKPVVLDLSEALLGRVISAYGKRFGLQPDDVMENDIVGHVCEIIAATQPAAIRSAGLSDERLQKIASLIARLATAAKAPFSPDRQNAREAALMIGNLADDLHRALQMQSSTTAAEVRREAQADIDRKAHWVTDKIVKCDLRTDSAIFTVVRAALQSTPAAQEGGAA